MLGPYDVQESPINPDGESPEETASKPLTSCKAGPLLDRLL